MTMKSATLNIAIYNTKLEIEKWLTKSTNLGKISNVEIYKKEV